MPRFNIYQQLQVIVDSFSFDCFPQFKFPTTNSYIVMFSPGNMLYAKCFSFTSGHIQLSLLLVFTKYMVKIYQQFAVFFCISHISKNVIHMYIPRNVLYLLIQTVLHKCAIAHLIDLSAFDMICDICAHLTCFTHKLKRSISPKFKLCILAKLISYERSY